MSVPLHEFTGSHADRPATRGELRLLLECPDCGTAGRIDLKRLSHGMRCRKCKCQFLISREGELLSLSELPHEHYSCPRCGESGRIPSALTVRKAACDNCRLPLVRGPDHKLHGAREAASLKRAAEEADRSPGLGDRLVARLSARPVKANAAPLLRTAWAAAALAGACVLCLALWMLASLSTESAAASFTHACLKGDWKFARNYLPDDAVQRVEFDRWRIRHFASIIERHRPAGDAVSVRVEPAGETPDALVFRVEMTSPFLGTRCHTQHWSRRDNSLTFDAQATLHSEDRSQPP